MKILKIAGIVAGIHAFLLILIFVIPGCNSTTRPPPQPADTVGQATSAPAPLITVPMSSGAVTAPPATDASAPVVSAPPAGFNPDAPASYAGDSSSGGGIHFTPTRPNSPAASALMSEPVGDVTPAATYAVKSGDSLWSIAKRNHISVSELAAANNLKTSAVLHQDQKLIIPGKAPKAASSSSKSTAPLAASKASSEPGAAPAKSGGEEMKHTVKSGETLGSIAHKYGVRVKDIEVRNNITDPGKVRVGTELIIPGWKSPSGSRSARSASSSASAPVSTPTATPDQSASPITAPATPDQGQSTPTTSIPVIHLDDNPLTPAPTK